MSNPLSVAVSLDTTANPAVTTDPDEIPVEEGETTITWTESATSPDSGFTFTSLSFGATTPSCFTNENVESTQISIDDDNECKGRYSYTLTVTYDDKPYSTARTGPGGEMGNPTIHNK